MVSSKDVKVGAFVLAGLTAMGAVIFLIGDERQLFRSKTAYSTAFEDIHGRLSISVDDARRIRKDSVATIEGKGLLGDKMIVVTVGTPGQAQLPEGSAIPSRPAEDFSKLMGRLSNISG